MSKFIIVLVAGGKCSGKREISNQIKAELINTKNLDNRQRQLKVEILNFDEYIKDDSVVLYGPERYDFQKLINDLKTYAQSNSDSENQDLVLVIHGQYTLYNAELRQLSTLKFFIDCDPDTRLNRWLLRDVVLAKADDDKFRSIIDTYLNHSRIEFNEFILKTRNIADLILQNDDNKSDKLIHPNIITLICDGILPMLSQKLYINKDMIYHRNNSSVFNFQSEQLNDERDRFYDLS
ncbi:hypothetical protein WICMUC_001190 [Wickerhamomyces mucosus]|uniref:Phosphoribulokinase/uridine kinase domain-containing protein n=1 Tax=Wickerhamomyces mucosus TaxID=1378264 RepID=A0A9P8PXN4_9ASCO|nr:hypothetical protein WICMUC_001190 [Wickerhamomyces mucosus]